MAAMMSIGQPWGRMKQQGETERDEWQEKMKRRSGIIGRQLVGCAETEKIEEAGRIWLDTDEARGTEDGE